MALLRVWLGVKWVKTIFFTRKTGGEQERSWLSCCQQFTLGCSNCQTPQKEGAWSIKSKFFLPILFVQNNRGVRSFWICSLMCLSVIWLRTEVACEVIIYPTVTWGFFWWRYMHFFPTTSNGSFCFLNMHSYLVINRLLF